MTIEAQVKEELLKLQYLIKEDFCGIIWLTSEKLNPKLPYFSALDYLVDGGLQQLINQSSAGPGNLVMTQSFGHSFFVAQYCTDDEVSKILSVLALVPESKVSNFSKLLILGTIPLEIERELKKKAPYLKFEILAS